MTEQFVVGLQDVDETDVALVGGKGANLGALSRIEGLRVPAGFSVTTAAFRRILAAAPSIDARLDQLSRLDPDDVGALGTLSADIRRSIHDLAIPGDLAASIIGRLGTLGETGEIGEHAAYAVRSSATAEDLPTASFAGQQDTYLNVVGPAAILVHISRCWASLFTERAVAYRQSRDIDHRTVGIAVVVQRMVFSQVSGVLFTADPVTSNRQIASVEASFGLGEAFVSGLVNADAYQVRDGEVITRNIGTKRIGVFASSSGGTHEQGIDAALQDRPTLTDGQVLAVAQLGRRIEAHFGRPQDVEWCLVDDQFQIVQSRPITTLFPIPESGDRANRVYLSVGHQQMMTDAMKPLGLSFWQMTTPAPRAEAGSRLFVDVTQRLASPVSRDALLDAVGRSDPLTGDALRTILERDDFIRPLTEEVPARPLLGGPPAPIETDPAIVTELIARSEASVTASEHAIRALSGEALLDFIAADLQELRRILFDPQSHQVFMSAMEAAWWLGDHLLAWLGERNAADTLTQSVPDNITSQMGLALLDVADVIRPHREVVALLQRVQQVKPVNQVNQVKPVKDDGFLEELADVPGGREARHAIEAWLERYGMRCVGEIDITRPRWSEHPSMLAPVILGNVKNFEPGAGARRFEQGRQEAWATEQDVVERLQALPNGEQKAAETKAMIDRVRTFIGYREYPKYGMVSRYFVYKRALLREAERLVQAHVLRDGDDIFYLRFAELHDVVRTHYVDQELIARRRDAFESDQTLRPPRVLTSDGEALNGSYHRDGVPTGALSGLPVSAGVVEGRARVILDMTQADLAPGDILVTAYTDPSWTPLFVAIGGLVTEVGGQMTHGAVIAREYGVPAVVAVADATRLIPDGQRIRVHGTDGYIEVLP